MKNSRKVTVRGRRMDYNKAYRYDRGSKSLSDGASYSYAFYAPRGAITGTVPLMIAIPGTGGSELTADGFCQTLVTNNPPIAAYSVASRGEGPAGSNMNDAQGSLYGVSVRELADLREQINHGIAMLGTLWSGKIGIRGKSKGGKECWVAAAYAGKSMPAYGSDKGWYRTSDTFPAMNLCVPYHHGPDIPWYTIPQDTGISHNGSSNIYGGDMTHWDEESAQNGNVNQGTRYNAAMQASVIAQCRADSPSGYLALFSGDTRFSSFYDSIPTELKTSNVDCILAQSAHSDRWQWLGSFFDHLKATVGPKMFVNIAPGGHKSPDNTAEELGKDNREYTVIKHYLLGSAYATATDWGYFGNSATTLATAPEVRWAVRPRANADFISKTSTWGDAYYNSLSNWDSETKTTLYPKNGVLGGTVGDAGNDTISHTWIDTNYDADSWMDKAAAGGNINSDLLPARITIDDTPYTLPDQGANTIIAGEVECELKCGATTAKFIVSAALFDYDGADETFITHGWLVYSGYTSGVVNVNFRMFPVIYRLASGNQLRLKLRNTPYDESGNASGDILSIMPIFTDYAVQVETNTTNQSLIKVPIMADATELD